MADPTPPLPPDLTPTLPATASPSPTPLKATGGRRKKLLLLLVALPLVIAVILLAVGFFLISDTGFRMFVLPRVAKSLGVEITASHVEWKPLSSIRLDDLRVGPESQPILRAKQLTARYDGREAWKGNYVIETLSVDSASIHIKQQADGSLPGIPAQFQPAGDGPGGAAAAPSPPPRVSCGSLKATNLELVYETPTHTLALQQASVTAKDLKPGANVPIEIEGEARWSRDAATDITSKLKASLAVTLDARLAPSAAEGTLSLSTFSGQYKDGAVTGGPATGKIHVTLAGGAAAVKEAHFALEKLTCSSPKRITSLSSAQLDVKNARAGGSMTFTLQTKFEALSPGDETLAARGQIHSDLVVDLNNDFRPVSAKGDATLDGLSGKFAGETLDGLSAVARVDLASVGSSSMLKEGRVSLMKNGTALASITAIGPLHFMEGHHGDVGVEAELDIQAGPVKSNVLNLYFADRKVDFQNTSLGYTGHLSLGKQGTALKAEGKLDASPFAFTSPALPAGAWKPAQISADHSVEFDFTKKIATITRLSVDGSQQTKPLLKGNLSQPMTLTWNPAAAASAAGDADFNLQIFSFDIAALAPILGLPADWKASSAIADGNLKVAARNQGKTLAIEGRLGLSNLALRTPNLALADGSILFDGKAGIEGLQSAKFEALTLKASEKGKPLGTATVSGSYDLSKSTGSGTIQFETPLPNILTIKPVANLVVFSGILSGKGEWKQEGAEQYACNGKFTARDLTFNYGTIQYQKVEAAFDGNVDWRGAALKVEKSRLAVSLDGKPAGSWEGSLAYNSRTQDAQLTFKVRDCKETIFAPLFTAWAPDRKLRSIELTSDGEWKRAKGAATLKATADVKKLLLQGGTIQNTKPLNVAFSADLTGAPDGIYTIRDLSIDFDPTPSVKNVFLVTGTCRPFSGPLLANLKLQGQALDLTTYYEQLFKPANPTTPTAPTAAAPATPSAAAMPATAAAAKPGPLPDITLQLSADSVKVDRVTLSDVNATFRQKSGTVELYDGRLKIGKAPVTFKLWPQATSPDPTRPSYNFYADVKQLEIAPLADLLKPELQGQVLGWADADVTGTGTGFSMADLRQSLVGDAHLKARNARLERLPTLRESLRQAGESLQSEDIAASTIVDLDASCHFASGKAHTDNLHMRGSAIEATLRGDIWLDHRIDLDMPAKIPPEVAKRSPMLRPLAVLSVGNPTPDPAHPTAGWITLPGDGKLTGTWDAPKFSIKLKITPESVIGTILNILGGDKKKDQPQDPQQPQQQQEDNPVGDLIDNLFKKKKK